MGSWYEKDIPSATKTRNKGGKVYNEPMTVQEVLKFPIKGNPARQLNNETAQYFGIRQELSKEDGVTIVATYYPSYNKNGQVIGFKKRDWTLPKEEKRHFTTVGAVKATNQLFGQLQADKGNNKKELFFAEGEEDVYCTWNAVLAALRKDVKTLKDKGQHKDGYGKFLVGKLASIEEGIKQQIEHGSTTNHMTINVVGLTCGAPNAAENVGANEKFIKKHEKVVLGLDNDHCTDQDKLKGNIVRGREASEAIAGVLLSENIYQVIFPHESNDPDGFKDPRDFVLAKQVRALADMFTKCDNLFTSEKIVKPSQLSVKRLRQKKKDGVPMRHMPELYRITRGPRTGELWTLTGPSGAGKSTIGREIEFDVIHYLTNGLREGMYDPDKVIFDATGIPRLDTYVKGERIGIIRLEEEVEETMNFLIALDKGFDPQDFSGDPSKYLTEEEHQVELDKWNNNDKIRITDHFGSMPIKNLINLLKQMVFLNGCRWIILDHLSMLVSGLRTSNEVKELDIIMTELAAFCKQHDVFILAVAHMKRKDFVPPKDGEGNSLPFWYPVRKEDLRGCLNASAEYLTPQGWKRFDQFEEGDEVAQYKDGKVYFGKPNKYVKLEAKQDMYKFANKTSFEMTLSGEHRVLVKEGGEEKVILAEDLAGISKGARRREKIEIVRHFNIESNKTYDENLLRVKVMLAADGCYHGNGLCKLELKKTRKVDRAHKLLTEAGLKYSYTYNSKKGSYTFRLKALTESKKLHECHDWYNSCQEDLKILLEESIFWDGSDKGDKGRTFSSSVKEEVDVVQFAAHANGMNTNIRTYFYQGKDRYELGINREDSYKNSTKLRSLEVSRVKPEDGFKYCFEVDSGFFVARENGKVFVTGNSAALEQLSWIVLGVEPEELPNRARGRVRVVSMKNRPHKKLGIADTLWMQPNGTFVPSHDWEVKEGSYYRGAELMHTFDEEMITKQSEIEDALDAFSKEPLPSELPPPVLKEGETFDDSTGEVMVDLNSINLDNEIEEDDPFE